MQGMHALLHVLSLSATRHTLPHSGENIVAFSPWQSLSLSLPLPLLPHPPFFLPPPLLTQRTPTATATAIPNVPASPLRRSAFAAAEASFHHPLSLTLSLSLPHTHTHTHTHTPAPHTRPLLHTSSFYYCFLSFFLTNWAIRLSLPPSLPHPHPHPSSPLLSNARPPHPPLTQTEHAVFHSASLHSPPPPLPAKEIAHSVWSEQNKAIAHARNSTAPPPPHPSSHRHTPDTERKKGGKREKKKKKKEEEEKK